MPGRKTSRPKASQLVSPPDVKDADTSRALGELVAAVQAVQARPSYAMVECDLAVGVNAIPHNLGRPVKVVQITKTVADATFDFAIVKKNAQASRQVLIDVVGVAQPGATLFLM